MKSIYKYTLGLSPLSQPITMRGEVVHVDSQYDNVTLWATFDEDAPLVERRFYVIGTGHHYNPDDLKYLGTAVTCGGQFVWHVMEVLG